MYIQSKAFSRGNICITKVPPPPWTPLTVSKDTQEVGGQGGSTAQKKGKEKGENQVDIENKSYLCRIVRLFHSRTQISLFLSTGMLFDSLKLFL